MDRGDTKAQIRNYVAEQFLPGEDPASITDDTRLVSDGILDSLGSLKLVSYLQERFGVTIEAHEVDVDYLDTLDSITDLVLSKKAG